MRLKSLNRNVEIFTVTDMAKFAQEYQNDYEEFVKIQQNYQL